MTKTNVIGWNGIKLQAKVKKPDGSLDFIANELIESAWKAWNKKGVCTVCGRLSGVDAQHLFIQNVVREGEAIVRKVTPWNNAFNFALQFFEADHLDEDYNLLLPNGGRIRMGIEFDRWGKPIAYHLLSNHPGAQYVRSTGKKYVRIPADEILHAFFMDRVNQARGVPSMSVAAKRLHMLDGYEDAELTAARVGASKMGFFTTEGGEEYEGDDIAEETDGRGNEIGITTAEPATFEQLPEGVGFEPFLPEHPTAAFDPFEKAMLRGIASGFNVAYVGLANNLEGVNLSSIRQGKLDEQDEWRVLQQFVVDHFLSDIYAAWLPQALLTGAVPLPFRKTDNYTRIKWQPRGWKRVDPLKEMNAHEKGLSVGVISPQRIAGEEGQELEEVFDEISKAKELADKYKIPLKMFENGDTKNV